MLFSRSILASVAAGMMAAPALAQVWSMPADFSDTQGQASFQYGYRVAAGNFVQMQQFDARPGSWSVQWGEGGVWTYISATAMHPNGITTSGERQKVEQAAVLRWVCPTRGGAQIYGHAAKELAGGNGVSWSIVRNEAESLVGFTLAGDDVIGHDFKSIVNVRPGDTIDFAVGSNNGNDGGDTTLYSFTVLVCAADIDDGSNTGVPDGGVDVADLTCFLHRFDEGGLIADVDDGSGRGIPDDAVDVNDLLYFLQRFEHGC